MPRGMTRRGGGHNNDRHGDILGGDMGIFGGGGHGSAKWGAEASVAVFY